MFENLRLYYFFNTAFFIIIHHVCLSLSQTDMLNTCVRLRSSLEGLPFGTVYFPEFSLFDSLLLRNIGEDDLTATAETGGDV